MEEIRRVVSFGPITMGYIETEWMSEVSKTKIHKGNGRFRTIYNPQGLFHRWFLKHHISPWYAKWAEENSPKHTVHGFMRGKSPTTNAYQHIGYEYTLSMDLQDFFDTVTPSMVPSLKVIFKRNESVDAAVYHDNSVAFYNGHLPQGFPSSPAIANCAAVGMDHDLVTLANRLKGVYTRYADDITFSSNSLESIHTFKECVIGVATIHGFTLNRSKTLIQYAKSGRRIITGVGVGKDGIYPTRKTKRKLRSAKHHGWKRKQSGFENWCKMPMPRGWLVDRRMDEEHWGDAMPGVKF